jgi:transcriptional regulator
MEDLDTTHANNTKIEKEAQNVIEKDLALWDQVANAKRATYVVVV